MINIEKREELLAGKSVWYSNADDIERDLMKACKPLSSSRWEHMTRGDFVKAVAKYFPALWQVHPFREGNTRSVVMMMTFFVEHHGYYMDQELMTASAGYVRNSFVLASIDQFSEFEHLEKILMDAVCVEPILYDETSLEGTQEAPLPSERLHKYQKDTYTPQPHYQRDN